jgi:hypothetical protein
MKMRKTFILVVTAIMVLGLSISAHAALIDLGGGMIYSTDLNLTWLQDANYAQTSGYLPAQPDGLMTWDQANTWATTLEYRGLTGWRLPTFDPDFSQQQCSLPFPPTFPTPHEMRYLLYAELGNNCISPHNYGPFINVTTPGPPHYWSGTNDPFTDRAYYFWFECG